MSEILRKALSERGINGVLPDEVARLVRDFVRCGEWVQNALEYAEGTHTAEDVLLSLLDGERQFWPGERCFVITEIAHYPRKRILNYFLAGGERGSSAELNKMLASLEAFAHAAGCNAVTLTGRPGWLRSFLQVEGYRRVSVTMAKELPDVENKEN